MTIGGAVSAEIWTSSAIGSAAFYVRSRGASAAVAPEIQSAVRGIDPRLIIRELATIDEQVDRLMLTERLLATLAGAFAAVATLLAMRGLYGVTAFTAERRTKEIGIRMALGASRWLAGGLIVREAVLLATVGLSVGLCLYWALGRFIESQLFGVSRLDLMTIAGAVAMLASIGVCASAIPANRAASVSPLQALRNE